MNKAAIKNFAIWARNKLIADAQYKAGLVGITATNIKEPLPQSTKETQFFDIGTAEPYAISGAEIKQRASLVKVINQKADETDYKTAYKYIIEEVSYTWFNRLIAVRFMEVNDYLPSHVRVLSSESGKQEPDLVTTPFEAELPLSNAEKQEIIRLKNTNELDTCFRMLFIKQCNALNEILPALFEKTSDYTELLLNISAIDKEGVVYHLVNDIPEADFDVNQGGQVEILGWLFQYYNTEPKNEAFGKNGKFTKEEVPAATQLFTPDWIVRYMVENSLGRLWLLGHPDEGLKKQWKYYLDEAEQSDEVNTKQNEKIREYAHLRPEDIRFIDPCMGSGHILVYAFDVFMQIYVSAGYSERDAAVSIINNNIHGLDIDDRAQQMAYFAVFMKARQYSRRIFSEGLRGNVYAVQSSNDINRSQLNYFGADLSPVEKNDALNQVNGLLDTFRDAKEYGSIINVDKYNWPLLKQFSKTIDYDGQMSFDSIGIDKTQKELINLILLGEQMSRKYEIVVTNPPYMGSSGMGAKLSTYLKNHYESSKSDMFAVFIERCNQMLAADGIAAMITQHAWMFINSYEDLRKKLYRTQFISLVHLGIKAFEEIGNDVVQTCAFVFKKTRIEGYKSRFVRLVDVKNYKQKEEAFLSENDRFEADCEEFEKIPGIPFAYWVSKQFIDNFKDCKFIDSYGSFTGSQNITGDNEKYLKLFWEVNANKVGNEWRFYAKGGDYRQYYGNLSFVVDWSSKGRRFYSSNKTSNLLSEEFWYKPGITYSAITSRGTGFRYLPEGCIFDKGGPSINTRSHTEEILSLLNSNVAKYYFWVFNPSINLQVKDIKNFPIMLGEDSRILGMSRDNIEACKKDWNTFETSWEFEKNPLIGGNTVGRLISDKYKEWEAECARRFRQLKANEEELNRIFIDIYGLQDELSPDVEERDVTVRKADLQRDIKSLLSYAVGCMFGRYSLDVDGLAYAGGEWDSSKYTAFIPDTDNILPITDEEYFEDDIVGLLIGWLKKVYGEDTLEQNLDFIAQALGNKGDTSRDIIRNYFVSDFFKDHCQTYSVTGSGKRPIYWLFDSGKQNGFKALIYLHRYNADTIGNLRVDYLHRMQRVYESEIGRMQDMIDHSTNSREVGAATKRKEKLQKQLKECHDYDEKIAHLALARTELDLDDGVKYNYRKVQMGTDGKLYEVLADSNAIVMDDEKFLKFKSNK